ncbi:WLM-domain-containing protein [Mycena polygramma]|nr:WLM-domain-containing protein [Mycena polygramma]
MADTISLTVNHRGIQHRLSVLPDSTLADLHATLEELTTVPPSMQKLLYKNSAKGAHDEMTVREAGLKEGTKVQMVGSTLQELDGLQAKEAEERKRDRIMRERALKAPVKVRSTATASTTDHLYRFHEITPLPHLPDPDSALTVLRRLANDKAIRHVMQKHKFSVGVLTEIDPRDPRVDPGLLGLNTNHGEEIKVRIRTDSCDGFRPYTQARRTLCHELAHNVFGPHDNDFKELNSLLNREVAEFERAASEGTHRLQSGDIYEPDALENEALTSHVLGGSSRSSNGDSIEERRRRMLEATLNRLQKEEEELENSCGTAGSAEAA